MLRPCEYVMAALYLLLACTGVAPRAGGQNMSSMAGHMAMTAPRAPQPGDQESGRSRFGGKAGSGAVPGLSQGLGRRLSDLSAQRAPTAIPFHQHRIRPGSARSLGPAQTYVAALQEKFRWRLHPGGRHVYRPRGRNRGRTESKNPAEHCSLARTRQSLLGAERARSRILWPRGEVWLCWFDQYPASLRRCRRQI